MSTIGTRIRDLRVSKGMTQTALSGNGISSGYVSLIESGKRTPSDRMVREIADRLGVSVEEILRSDETPRVVDPRLSDHARLDVNFAKMALANGNAAGGRAHHLAPRARHAGQHHGQRRREHALAGPRAVRRHGRCRARAAQPRRAQPARRGLGRPRARRHHADRHALRVRRHQRRRRLRPRLHGRDREGRPGRVRRAPAPRRHLHVRARSAVATRSARPRSSRTSSRSPTGSAPRAPAAPSTGTPPSSRTVGAPSTRRCGSPTAPSRCWARRRTAATSPGCG